MPPVVQVKSLVALAVLSLSLPLGAEEAGVDWARAREFWAFQAPRPSAAPKVKDPRWPRTKVDRFLLAAMEQRGLQPSQPAPDRQLLRRVFFDLTGLPPTPGELRRWADLSGGAYERLVDELLNRRAFGERMASLWLNLSRYAEDQAHLVGKNTSLFYPNAFRYRQWVIDAFNRDLPYDEFIRYQLAIDRIDPDNRSDLAALGFMGLGHKYYSRSRLDVQAEEWAEKVDTLTRSLLGLTVACAQCHDHKYDPVTMRDYYALAGVFANLKMVNKSPDGVYEKKNAKAEEMSDQTLHLVEDAEEIKDLNIFLRGDVESKGPVVPRGFPRILSHGRTIAFTEGSGRRELAEAIASRENPLTARVMVNRLWAMVFGRGLVGTPSNFGQLGERPTHPELLDDLAVRFMDHGWSIKWLLRELVLSAAYRQSSAHNAANAARDESNRYLWRMNRRRLTIEQFRDAVLQASGAFDPAGGKSLELDDEKNLRRTVYSRVSRRQLNRTLMLFDYPDANVHAAGRVVSTTAPQKLYVMNNPFMIQRARDFAARLRRLADNDSDRIAAAYRIAYARPPSEAEQALGLKYLGMEDDGKMTALERYAQALLAANEMIYLD